jgi:hypothetical protein
MSDWTYEPLIVKLKAALAEAESGPEVKEPATRTAPIGAPVRVSAAERDDSEPDRPRSGPRA